MYKHVSSAEDFSVFIAKGS